MLYLVPIKKKFRPCVTARQHMVESGNNRSSKCGVVFQMDSRYTKRKKAHNDIPICRKCKSMMEGKWRLNGYEFV